MTCLSVAASGSSAVMVHLSEMPFGGVYSKLGAAARSAKPGPAAAIKLAGLEQTVFQGTTLRGLLLEAYGFATFGAIAFWAGISAFILAGLMLILVGFGFWYSRRVKADAELLGDQTGREAGRGLIRLSQSNQRSPARPAHAGGGAVSRPQTTASPEYRPTPDFAGGGHD